MTTSISEFIKSKGFEFNPVLDNTYREETTEQGRVWYKGNTYETGAGVPFVVFTFGHWKSGDKFYYKDDLSAYSAADLKEMAKRRKRDEQRLEEERRELHFSIAKRCLTDIKGLQLLADSTHPYLVRKRIGSLPGAYLRPSPLGNVSDDLIIPTRDTGGKVWGWQKISPCGEKTFIDGQRTSGLYFQIGKLNPKYPIFIVEGVATGASLYDILQNCPKTSQNLSKACVLVAFNATNLKEVGKELRILYPHTPLIFSGDNDVYTDKNVGMRASYKAAHQNKGTVLLPMAGDMSKKVEKGDIPLTDWNDLVNQFGIEAIIPQVSCHEVRGPSEVIPTEYNGFHSSYTNIKGVSIHEPEYVDLADWLHRERGFKVQNESEQIYVWDGKKYVDTPESEIRGYARKNFWIDWKPKCNNKKRNEFVGEVTSRNLVSLEWFNRTTKGKLNFQNGVLDLKTNKLVKHDAGCGFRAVLDYDYDEHATCPEFDAMMGRITAEDESLKLLLLEYMGYCLSNDKTWAQKALVCIGSGSNGKSTFFDVLRSLMGEDNAGSVSVSDFNNDQKLHLLDGKLCNISEESKDTALYNTAEAFKNIVTGGDVIAKKLYAQPYKFKNRAKLILSYNTFPRAGDTSHGLVRRLLFANFNVKFDKTLGNHDPDTLDRVLLELPGIFNRAWSAYQDARKRRGFTSVESSEKSVEEFQIENDPVRAFVNDHVTIAGDDWAPNGSMPSWFGVNDAGRPFVVLKSLFAEFSAWYESSGFKYPPNINMFCRSMNGILDEKVPGFSESARGRIYLNNERVRVLWGVTHVAGSKM